MLFELCYVHEKDLCDNCNEYIDAGIFVSHNKVNCEELKEKYPLYTDSYKPCELSLNKEKVNKLLEKMGKTEANIFTWVAKNSDKETAYNDSKLVQNNIKKDCEATINFEYPSLYELGGDTNCAHVHLIDSEGVEGRSNIFTLFVKQLSSAAGGGLERPVKKSAKPPMYPCKNIKDKKTCDSRPMCRWNDATNVCEDIRKYDVQESSPGVVGRRQNTAIEQDKRKQTNSRQKEKHEPEERVNVVSMFGGTRKRLFDDIDDDSDDSSSKTHYYFIF